MALAPKKSIALQTRRQPSAGVSPISGRSSISMTASPPTEAPVPLAGQVDTRAQGMPLEVVEQSVTVVIPLSTAGRTELPTVLVAPTVVGATPPVEAPTT